MENIAKRNYHRDNCSGKVRRTILTTKTHSIVLVGIHAFEWSIIVSNKLTASIKSYVYPNRKAAEKDIPRIKRHYLCA